MRADSYASAGAGIGTGGQRLEPNWKPLFYSPFYILFIVLLHILYIIGVQVVVSKHANDQPLIARVQANETLPSSQGISIFIFDESDLGAYLAWQYLPVAIATVLAILWESLDLTVRRLEPYRQLASPEGGNTYNALCLDYASMFSYVAPFSAFRRRHYAVTASSTIYVFAASLIPTLAGGMWSIEWGSLSYSAKRISGPGYATVEINSGLTIATQVFHGITAAIGLWLAWTLFTRQTGLYRDPQGVGGVLSLIGDCDATGATTLRLFRQLPSFAHSKVLTGALQASGATFRLQHLPVMGPNGAAGLLAYQLTSSTPPSYVVPLRQEDRSCYRDRWDATGWWLTRRAVFLAECILWLGQAACIGALYQVAKILQLGDAAKPTIAKMVLTLMITIGGMMWQSIQREVQVFEPWRQLSKGPRWSVYRAAVQCDVLSLGLIGSAIFSAVRLSLIAAWAAFSAGMVYIATVFLPPLLELAYAAGMIKSYSPYETKTFGVMSGNTALGLAITGIAIHIVIFINFLFMMFNGRTKPFLPRRPTTIASQILYVCRSDRLLDEFSGLSMVSKKELAQQLNHTDQGCRFGWFWWARGGAWCVGVEEVSEGDTWYLFNFVNGAYGFQPCT